MDRASQLAEQIAQEVFRRCHTPTASRIVAAMSDDRVPLRALEETINAAPVLANRLLLLANLANRASPRWEIVSQATRALGLDYIKPLILGWLAYDGQPRGPLAEAGEAEPIMLRDLWEHALTCAMIAAKLAAKLANISPLQAFTAGLIHDIGRVLLWRHSNAEFAAAVALARKQRLPIWQAEASAIGIDHAVMGEAWCDKCDIAAPLAAVVRRHHEPMTMANLSGADGLERLIAVIRVAESLAEKTPLGLVDEGLADDATEWSSIGLNKADWAETAQGVWREVESLREAFGFRHVDRAKAALHRREPALPSAALPASTPSNPPVNRGQILPFPPSGETARRVDARPLAEKLVLLVVEDHGSLCDMVSLFLMRSGYHVRTANNGAIALEILAREEIHIMLLDLMLPQVGGFEVLRQVHKTRQKMLPYIIVVSAGASDQDRKKLLDLGADEFLPKPFHLARLLERVQAVEQYLL